MSFALVENVLAHAHATPASKLLLVVLARHANDDGLAWPTVDTLAAYLDLSTRYVRKCLRELEADGYVTVVRSGVSTNTHRLANKYQLLIPDCDCPRSRSGHIDHRPARPAPDPDDLMEGRELPNDTEPQAADPAA